MFYRIAHALVYVLYKLIYRLKIVGREKVPPGSGVVCGNHTSLGDPVIVALALRGTDKPSFMAKKELFRFKPFAWLIGALGAFPVDRDNADIRAIKQALSILRSGRKLLVFPEGTRVAEDEAVAAKNGAAMLASKTNSPIIPVNITRGRKPFVNKITVVFGEPFEFPPEKGKISPQEYPAIIEQVMGRVRELGGNEIG